MQYAPTTAAKPPTRPKAVTTALKALNYRRAYAIRPYYRGEAAYPAEGRNYCAESA